MFMAGSRDASNPPTSATYEQHLFQSFERKISESMEKKIQEMIGQTLNDKIGDLRNDLLEEKTAVQNAAKSLLADKLEAQAELEYLSGETPVPPSQQLTTKERNQLDFFLQSPGIGMVFLSVAFALSGEDTSGTLVNGIRNAGILEQTVKIEGDFFEMFPDIAENVENAEKVFTEKVKKFKDDFVERASDVFSKARDVADEAISEFEAVKQRSESVMQEMKAALKNFKQEAAKQASDKIDFMRKRVLPMIVQDIDALIEKLLKDEKKIDIKEIQGLKGLITMIQDFLAHYNQYVRHDLINEIRRQIVEKAKRSGVLASAGAPGHDGSELSLGLFESITDVLQKICDNLLASVKKDRGKFWGLVMAWVRSKTLEKISPCESGKAQSCLVKYLVAKITTATGDSLQLCSCPNAPG
jgi:hypothetical protein